MAKSLLGGGAAAALLSVSLIFYADPSIAQPLTRTAQEPLTQQKSNQPASVVIAEAIKPPTGETSVVADKISDGKREVNFSSVSSTPPSKSNQPTGILSPQAFVATAYSLRGRTASGRLVTKGIIAADRRVLPLGTRVHVQAGSYSGEYLVADTGGAVRGRKIDIWMPSTREAIRFGRQRVKLTVLSPAVRKKASPSRPARGD